MSYVFDVGDDTVWSPSLQVGDLYVRFLCEIAETLGVRTGLTAIASDMYEIDIDVFANLVRKLFDVYFSSGHPVLRGLIEGVLAPSVVVLERGGRPLTPSSDEEREFIERARGLSMAR
ncbi:DUF6086 family protein [Gandjariella thermophila]|uniref:DUF6086 family protein n=1 Tax=Gandjariella thermophila TaxID=1931992 RepID=UPI0010F49029|nr:DUF6086 family protein [Gandjariella thermophila]